MTNLLTTLAKAAGFTPGQEVDIWYALHKSLQVLCAKLDDDAGVGNGSGTYEANCWTAIINCSITNSQGNRVANALSNAEGFASISPMAPITPEARQWIMYNFANAWETLCEQIDGDATVTLTTYEANCWTAMFLHTIKDPKGVTDLGNETNFYFTAGHHPVKWLLDWFYNAYNALETLAEQLDGDGGVTDTDYEELTYEAYCLVNVENSAGNSLGNG
jgi:hypothetical protein